MILFGIRKDHKVKCTDGTVIDMPCILPAHRAQLEDWQRIKPGKFVKMKITHERELNHHNQLFAIMAFTFENLPEGLMDINSFDCFREWVLLKIGYALAFMAGGQAYIKAKSISFQECDQIEFMDKVYNPGINFCSELLGMSRDEIITASQEWREKKLLYSSRRE